MQKWILLDLKRTLFSRKSYILIFVVMASIFTQLYLHSQSNRVFDQDGIEILEVQAADSFANDLARSQIWGLYQQTRNKTPSDCIFDSDYDPEMYPENNLDKEKCSLLHWFDQTYGKYITSIQEPEELTEDQAISLYYYLVDKRTDVFFDDYDNQDEYMQNVIYEKSLNFDQVKAIKESFKARNDFEDYEEFETISQPLTIYDFNKISEELVSIDYIYSNNLPSNLSQSLTASFFIAKYINNFFLLLLVVGVLIIFDSFYRDYKSGVIKNILSSPIKRHRYIIMKTISSFLAVFIIIALPVLLTALGLYIYMGYDSANYPIYISKTTLNSLIPSKEYSPIINSHFPKTHYSTFKNICMVGPVTSTSMDLLVNGVSLDAQCYIEPLNVTSISLKHFILLLMAYYLLLMTFIASLNSLLSLVINKELINLIAILVMIALSGLISNFFIGSSVLKLLPFTFINPTRLIMGTLPYTFLNGVVTLSIWTLGLIITNLIVIKRKDFTY